jgi:CBS domain-containing protein
MCVIFFDFNCLYGEEKLVQEISKSIFKSINSFEIFLNYLGRNAVLNPPPVGFFRQFIVESDGAHKNQFDLKARALMPLIDASRLLILSHQIGNKVNTIERYQTLAKLEPQNKSLYESCIDSFKILQRYRAEQGLLNNDSGRYLKLQTLSKSEKLRLKGCFKPIKDVQELLNTRYQLSQIM